MNYPLGMATAKRTQKERPFEEEGRWITEARESVSSLNPTAFAAVLGFHKGQWSDYENGHDRISLNAAVSLYKTYGISLDFLYFGRLDGLVSHVREKIETSRRKGQDSQ